jgi:transposase
MADRPKPAEERGRYECIVDPGELVDPQTHAPYAVRRLYIRSSRKAEQAQAKREREIDKVRAELEHIESLLNKYDYTTLETVRARVAQALRLNRTGRYFEVRVTKTRAQVAPLRMTWRVCPPRVRAEARWDGIYAIITNLPVTTHTPDAVMEIYKDQYHVEWRFRDVNQLPIQVRPLWLKNPARIEALVFLVMLAVLVFALIERQVRHTNTTTGRPIVGLMPEKRDTLKPKGQRLLRAFQYMSVVVLESPRGRRYYLSELTAVQRQIVAALGLADLSSYLAGLATRASQAQALPQG